MYGLAFLPQMVIQLSHLALVLWFLLFLVAHLGRARPIWLRRPLPLSLGRALPIWLRRLLLLHLRRILTSLALVFHLLSPGLRLLTLEVDN